MELHPALDKAITEAANVVRGVDPARLDAPTPCRDWDVRTLTNHLFQDASALALAGRRQPVPSELWTRDLTATPFDEVAGTAVAAWARPEAWDGTVTFGDMQMPAPMVAAMLVCDLAIHGWDLARATGQSYRCDGEVAEATLRFVESTVEQGRQMGIFAPALPVADDAPVFDRALALSGRDPHWSA